MEKKTSFTWIPFYTEMAEKLLEYKDNRKELVKIVYGMDEEDVSFFKDDRKNNFKDLHPFALFGIFNRQILPYKKIRICTYLKDKLQIKSDIPSDFDGLPTVDNRKSWWGMPWSKNDASKDIKSNWKLFEIIQKKQINEDDLKNEFNFILSRGGAKKYLTMALYWIRPYEFMPLDSNSREYLQKIGINVFDEKDLNGQNYLDLCELIKDKIANNEIKEKSIPEISINAWIEAHQGDSQMEEPENIMNSNKRIWKVSHGIADFTEKEITECLNGSYVRVHSYTKAKGTSSLSQGENFIENVNTGDLFYLCRGNQKILLIGKFTSDPIKIDEDGWVFRKYEKLYTPIKNGSYNGPSRWWTPNNNSTFIEIKKNDYPDFESLILKPFFGIDLQTLNLINGEKNMEKINEYANLLKNTKNLILTGAPGTGKTYLAKQIAKELGCKDDNIGFVQFHPSYDYTDFVEGLRPTDKDGNVGFERRDGVFKEFCARALKNLVDSRKSVDVLQHERTITEIVEDFLNDAVEKKTQFETHTKNPFSVESFTDRKVFVSIPQNEKVKTLPIPIDDILELISNDVQLNIVKDVSEYFNRKWRTQQDSYIYVLTKQIQKNVKGNKNNETVTMEKIQAQDFVFIIDEINRGEVAKIFGELFYCVDPGYRGEKGWIKTQYANLETDGNIFDRVLQKKEKDFGHFFIPENVYIIGTMNDIDRSVESMDFAFRRRFTWAEVKAEDTQYMLDAELDKDLAEKAKTRMDNLNAAIWSWDENKKESKGIDGLNEAYHIGASYFLKLKNYDGDFECLWEYHIKGILTEYLRSNPNGKLDDLKAAYDREEEK